MKSEFGRGYAVCLLMFAFHEPRIDEYVDLNALMRSKGEARLFSEDDACESWANGSSDHLYDLVRPKRGVTRAEWERAKALQARALDVGHGFRFTPRADATAVEMHRLCADARVLIDLAASRLGTTGRTFEDAWALDEALGLRPLRGNSATCTEPIKLRKRPA